MRIPTAAQYKKAFLAIRGKMHPKHFEMLRANYDAPNHNISVDDLASSVQYKRAWPMYGRLGRWLCEELDFRPTMKSSSGPIYTQVLADFPDQRSQESWEWTLRPQVVRALEELGWLGTGAEHRAYVIIWNPSEWLWGEDDYAEEVRQTAAGKLFSSQWSCGNTKKIRCGDRLYLLRVDSDRGLIGSGFVTKEPFYDDHWDGTPGRKALYIGYQSDVLLNVKDRLPIDWLLEEDLGVHWNRMQKSGIEVPQEYVGRLEQLWQTHLIQIGRSVDAAALVAHWDHDATTLDADETVEGVRRVLRQIVQRRGQPVFREQLLDAYEGRCAVTGCNAKAALEAAHIEPYSGPSSNRVSNGLLLRSDIHTLFDLGLLAISPDKLTVALGPELVGTQYDEIAGKAIRLPRPAKHRPDNASLARRWKKFKKRKR